MKPRNITIHSSGITEWLWIPRDKIAPQVREWKRRRKNLPLVLWREGELIKRERRERKYLLRSPEDKWRSQTLTHEPEPSLSFLISRKSTLFRHFSGLLFTSSSLKTRTIPPFLISSPLKDLYYLHLFLNFFPLFCLPTLNTLSVRLNSKSVFVMWKFLVSSSFKLSQVTASPLT